MSTKYRTPRTHDDHTIVACVECGHLHYDATCKGYTVCPLGTEGWQPEPSGSCECTGQSDAPYFCEPYAPAAPVEPWPESERERADEIHAEMARDRDEGLA